MVVELGKAVTGEMPRIVASMGDPGGIGPEIAAVAAADPRVRQACIMRIVGDLAVLERAAQLRRVPLEAPAVVDIGLVGADAFGAGRVNASNGHASFVYVTRAIDEVLAEDADAVVTAPISKAAWHAAGHTYPGHTEYLAERSGSDTAAIMLCAGPLRSVLVTGHVALRDALDRISEDAVLGTLRLGGEAARRLTDREPRIGVTGLNPHAGEEGILGDEDDRLIRPAVERAIAEGWDASGPHPADALYRRAAAGHYDVVVAMYHDQGLIPVKVFGHGVNVTLGTSVVRTSPDHGTAFDIAGAGVADAESMVLAILMAASLASG
jgi:4-hydroxythreonine-4-phosphate dehydrogenase